MMPLALTLSALCLVQNESDNWRTLHPEWIWCDDFEQDVLGSYFGYDSSGGDFVRVAGAGIGGSTAMRSHFHLGQVSAGSLHLAFGRTPSATFKPVDAGTHDYRDIYWRVYVRNQPGWTGGGGNKFSRALVFANSNWAEAAFGHVWSGGPAPGNYLGLDPASGTDAAGNLRTTQYNDFANMRWLGWVQGQTPIFDSAHVGQWYCVEAHMKLNTPGQSDGVFELWINGHLDAQHTGLNWCGAYTSYGINAVFLENYWNAGSPMDQERYFDNFVVSTQPIGPIGGSTPGPTPTPTPTPSPTPTPPPPPPPTGTTYLLTNEKSSLALDVEHSGTTAGTPVWEYTANGTSAQNWKITPTGDGYYYLTNPNSGMDLNVPGASTSAGAQLLIWTHTPGATNAEWAISLSSHGTFTLTNRHSGLVLDVQGGGTALGTPAVQSVASGATSQEWTIAGFTLPAGSAPPPGPSSAGPAASSSPGSSSGMFPNASCGLLGLEVALPLVFLGVWRRRRSSRSQ